MSGALMDAQLQSSNLTLFWLCMLSASSSDGLIYVMADMSVNVPPVLLYFLHSEVIYYIWSCGMGLQSHQTRSGTVHFHTQMIFEGTQILLHDTTALTS